MRLIADIDAIRFVGRRTFGETEFVVRDVTGWFGGVSTRGERVDRPDGHGEFDARVFRTARMVTIVGVAHADSSGALDHLEQVLTGIGSDGQSVPIRVSRDGAQQHGDGRVVDSSFDRRGGDRSADFQLMLRMSNPRKYGAVREYVSDGQSTIARHYGNVEAIPFVTVTGDAPGGYRLRTVGRTWVGGEGLGLAHVDVVDMRTGLVLRNGEVMTTGLVQPKAWTVPKGNGVAWSVEPRESGTVHAVLRVADTFI